MQTRIHAHNKIFIAPRSMSNSRAQKDHKLKFNRIDYIRMSNNSKHVNITLLLILLPFFRSLLLYSFRYSLFVLRSSFRSLFHAFYLEK